MNTIDRELELLCSAPGCANQGGVVEQAIKLLTPLVDEIAEERADVLVGKVNVDDDPSLAMEFGVVSIPTLVVLRNGKPVAQAVGARPKDAILAMLDA